MSVLEETKDLLQRHFDALRAQLDEYKIPLEQARAERDGFHRDNIRFFEQEKALADKVIALQSDPALTELENAISAAAQALGGLRIE